MQKTQHRLSDVYGVSRDLPLNYVARNAVDGELVEALTRDKHIVIYGSSKQGKTSVRKWNLNDDDYILVSCQSKWTLADLHSAILKRSGYMVEQSRAKTTSGSNKVTASLSAKLTAKIFGSGAEVAGQSVDESAQGSSSTMTHVPLELDPADPNDVIHALEEAGLSVPIVLEDFHYLPQDTQAEFAVALKTFHESSKLVFIVVGVWLDENRLVQHNGDLTGRLVTVNADAWSPEELEAVIRAGGQLLNIGFDAGFIQELVRNSFESVWVVQEACFRACDAAGIYFTQDEYVDGVGKNQDVDVLVRHVVETQSARYNGFLEHFPDGFQATDLEMYKWLLLPVLAVTPERLEKGLHMDVLRTMVNKHHPRGPLNDMSFLQALRQTPNLQIRKSIKPIILDYDQTARRLTVVDRGFLIWLRQQDRNDLLKRVGLPAAAE